MSLGLEPFLTRWRGVSGGERANYRLFLFLLDLAPLRAVVLSALPPVVPVRLGEGS